jgi:hypothetical protein
MKTEQNLNININKIGYYSSIILAIITLITFGFAITAVPISGEFCLKNCIEYPYLNTLSQFPKDYYWMFLAIILIITYLILIVSIHSFANSTKQIFSRISLAFTIISSAVLVSCYYIQFNVVPASLKNGETDGIALITQYNPNGIFIALEELGYILMSFAFLFIAPVFEENNLLHKCIRWIFIINCSIVIFAFAVITIKYGLRKGYLFEVFIISINWLVLVVNGILVALVFKKELKKLDNS